MQILFLSTGKTKEEDNRRQHLSLMENVTGAKYIVLGIYPRKISPCVRVCMLSSFISHSQVSGAEKKLFGR